MESWLENPLARPTTALCPGIGESDHKFNKLAKGLAQPVMWRTKTPFLMPVLLASIGLVLAGQLQAQTFTTLHAFAPTATNSLSVLTNSIGASPYAGLTASADGKTYYGTASL